MVTEAEWGQWKSTDLVPYLDIVLAAFGEDRQMVGSDWPVCLLSASYEDVIGLIRDYFRESSESAQRKVFGENAAQFYGIDA